MNEKDYLVEEGMHKISGGDESSFAWSILKEQIKSSKRWFIAFLVVLGMLFCSNMALLYYIYKFDTSVITTTQTGTSNINGERNVIDIGDPNSIDKN